MPRRNISYRPVRYFLRRKNLNSQRQRDQSTNKAQEGQEGDKHFSSDTQEKNINSYPINNILVLPNNSETLINVINPGIENFSFNKLVKKINKRKRKEKQKMKKRNNKEVDVKPDVSKLKVRNEVKSSVNKHTIILSDSEDDSSHKEDESDDDDDVIFVETVEKENEIIEIEDSNVEPSSDSSKTETDNQTSSYKTSERNELLCTPESSNDFLENTNSNINQNFNFSLHGSDFKDSQFLKPSVPVDVSDTGSTSSVSDINCSNRDTFFNVIDFPKEKDNLFNDNLEKFRDSITPSRPTSSKDISEKEKNLPTLSHIECVENETRRVRGRSIIREMVNDRAYVLLSSNQKKLKNKKCLTNDDMSDSIDNSRESSSTDNNKKKKKKKKKKDADETYNEFKESTGKMNLISSSPMIIEKKNKKKDSNDYNIAVRSDLFPDCESDTSISDKKSRKKQKVSQQTDNENISEQYESKKKHKKIKEISEEPENKKRKKDKSLHESSIVENTDTNENSNNDKPTKIKKKKKRVIDFDDDTLLSKSVEQSITESINEQEDTDTNENSKNRKKRKSISENENDESNTKTKHKKKRSESENETNTSNFKEPENLKETTENSDSATKSKPKKKRTPEIEIQSDADTSKISDSKEPEITKENKDASIENTEISTKTKNKKKRLSETEIQTNNETDSTVKSSDHKESENLMENKNKTTENCEKPTEPINVIKEEPTVDITSINKVQDTTKIPESTEHSAISVINTSIAEKPTQQIVPPLPEKEANETLNSTEKSNSVWNMCSSNFYSSSDSLFVVSNVRTVSESEENLDIIAVAEAVVQEPPIESIEKNKEKQPINESSPEIPIGNENISPIVEVKTEKETNENTEPSKISENIPESNTQEKDVETVIIKVETEQNIELQEKEIQDSINTLLQSSAENPENECIEITGIIEKIFQEKDKAKSVTQLCQFLEEVRNPNDILKNVLMIKQAFSSKTPVEEERVEESSDSDDEVCSISSSGSSVMCIEENVPIINIEEDIILANLDTSTTQVSKDNTNEEVNTENRDVTNTDKSTPTENAIKEKPQEQPSDQNNDLVYPLKCGTVEKYKKGLDKYEVRDVQKSMSDNPKLWRISPSDIYMINDRRKCSRCKINGHNSYDCPSRGQKPKCYLCGDEGHSNYRCPNQLCIQCGKRNAMMQNTCKYCKHFKDLTCSLCKYKGHPRNKCPDLWRRYHLTVANGPIVKSANKELDRENLWCSYCAKSGHLQHYCYSAKKHNYFQALDPQIQHYDDVYEQGSNNSNSEGTVISKSVFQRLQPSIDDQPKMLSNVNTQEELKSSNTPPTKGITFTNVPSTSVFINPEQGLETNTSNISSLSNLNYLENPQQDLVSNIPSLLDLNCTLEKLPSNVYSSSTTNFGINDLPPEFVVVDEVCNDSIEERNLVESNNLNNENVHPLENENIPKFSQSKIHQIYKVNPSIVLDSESSHYKSKFMKGKNLRKNIKIPNFDIQKFFLNSDKQSLKEFVKEEINILKHSYFNIKSLCRSYHHYNQNSANLSVSKTQIYFKSVHMLLFGQECIKSGKVQLEKLECFINAVDDDSTLTRTKRESLYYAYTYIFTHVKQKHCRYFFLLKLLMVKYGYSKSNDKDKRNKRKLNT